MRRMLPFILKVAISIAMLVVAFRLVDFGALQERLARLDLRWATAALLILACQFVLGSLRWQLIVLACGAQLDRAHAIIYTLIGAFFNQVTPSTVGGDAVRMWLLARKTSHWKSSIYSVLIDRVVGLIWLALLVM